MGQDTYLAGRRAGDGVDAIGGAEAIISHLVTKHLQIPCAHAPALGERILMYLLYVSCMLTCVLQVSCMLMYLLHVPCMLLCVLFVHTHVPSFA